MADAKISALAALTGANTDPVNDVFVIVDTSATTDKKIAVAEVAKAMHVMGTEQASTSGTSIDFTGIPAGVKRITIMFVGVSTNGTSHKLIQLGDAGGFEATGYSGASTTLSNGTPSSTNYTTGFGIESSSASDALHGTITLTLENASAFTWTATGIIAASNGAGTWTSAGSKSLSAELTQVRITTVNGSDAFDAGAINIQYEY